MHNFVKITENRLTMKKFCYTLLAVLAASMFASCDAFRTLNADYSSSQGRAYEMIVVCDQASWTGELGDTLRSVLEAEVPCLNQPEPLYDVMRVLPSGFTKMIVNHRNILKVIVDKSLPEVQSAVQYDVTAQPQIVVTLQGPDQQSLTEYVSTNREEIVRVFEQAERDRSVNNARRHGNAGIEAAIKKHFGVEMPVPTGYLLAADDDDFVWARYEYPKASQGFMVYSYPYEGPQSLTAEAIVAARNRFAARIPGPSEGSYMTTSPVIEPLYRMVRMEGRLWCEVRGVGDVEGDFMGGPFVSYTTVDTSTNRVFTLDCYVYAPDLNKPSKRNYMRGVEHLFYGIEMPADGK